MNICVRREIRPEPLITAELGRVLAVVKVTSQVNGNTQFSESSHLKTISAVKMKFGTIDCVGEGNSQPVFGINGITGGFSPSGEI